MRGALLLSLLLHAALLSLLGRQLSPAPTPVRLPLEVRLLASAAPPVAAKVGRNIGKAAARPAAATLPPPSRASRQPPAVTPHPAATATAVTGRLSAAPAPAPASGAPAAATLPLAAERAAAGRANAAAATEKAGESREVRVRFGPKPAYPALSRELGEEGVVLLRIAVSASGQSEQVQLLRSSGFLRLDRAARDGVRQWRFEAALQAGQPVAASIDIPVHFRLDEA